MKKYREIAAIYLKTQLIWRTDTIIDVLLSATKILFAWILWGILFQGKQEIAGFGFPGMVSYYIVSSYLFQLEQSAEISQQMTMMIRNGTFSKYMILPVHLEGYMLAMEVGKMAFSAAAGLLATLVWIWICPIQFVHTKRGITFICSLFLILLGLLFMAELNYFLGILTLKFEDISTFLMIKDNLSAIVTGAVIPLTLMPEWVLEGLRLLPFYYITYLPSMLLIGRCETEAGKGMLILGGWCLIFAVLNRVTYQRYRIKYDGVGI